MTAGVLVCDGSVSLAADGSPVCSGVWMLTPIPMPFDPSMLDTAQAVEMFGAGFVIVGTLWFAGWCCRSILSMLR